MPELPDRFVARPRAALLLAALVGLGFAACQPRPAPSAPEPTPVAEPDAPAATPRETAALARDVLLNPKTILYSAERQEVKSDPIAEVTTAVADVAGEAALNAMMREDNATTIQSFLTEARSAASEEKALGYDAPGWSLDLDWHVNALSPKLVGVSRTVATFTGGAHGLSSVTGLIYPRGTAKELPVANLFTGDSLPQAIELAICRGLVEQKLERIGEATLYSDLLTCSPEQARELVTAASIGLLPSDAPDRIGGLVAYFDPYAAGSYAEGGYGVPVAQEAFANLLKPEWAAEFSGQPTAGPSEP